MSQGKKWQAKYKPPGGYCSCGWCRWEASGRWAYDYPETQRAEDILNDQLEDILRR